MTNNEVEQSNETIDEHTRDLGWEVCPKCGAKYSKPVHYCQQCHYYSPTWWIAGQVDKRGRLRRRLFILVALLFMVIGFALGTSPRTPNPFYLLRVPASNWSTITGPKSWAVYGGNPAHTRYIEQAKAVEGRQVWETLLGNEPTDAEPAVVDGVVYVGGHFMMYAFEAATGKLLWKTKTTGPVHSTAAVAGPNLYFGLLDSRVLALNRETGRMVWEFDTDNFVFNSPIVIDGIVYIGSGDNMLYALDAKLGTVLWKTFMEGRVTASAAYADGSLYVSSSNRSVYHLGANVGVVNHRFRSYRGLSSSPVIANNMVYYSTWDGHMYSLKFGLIEIPGQYQFKWMWMQFWLWRLPVPPPPPQTGAGWRASPKSPRRGFSSAPAVTPKEMYIGDKLGWIYAINPADGKTVWRVKGRGKITAAPVVAGKMVYVGTQKGNLYAVDRMAKKKVWMKELGSPIMVAPVYANGRLYVRTEDGRIRVFE